MKQCIECRSWIDDLASVCLTCKAQQKQWKNWLTYFAGTATLLAVVGSLATYSFSTISALRDERAWKQKIHVTNFGRRVMTVINGSNTPVHVSHVELSFDVPGKTERHAIRGFPLDRFVEPNKFLIITFHQANDPEAEKAAVHVPNKLSEKQWQFIRQRLSLSDPCVLLSSYMVNDREYLNLMKRGEPQNRGIDGRASVWFYSGREAEPYLYSFPVKGVVQFIDTAYCSSTKAQFHLLAQ